MTFAMTSLLVRSWNRSTNRLNLGRIRQLSSRVKASDFKEAPFLGGADHENTGRPATPISFGEEFSIEQYTGALPLEVINEHELDKKITFDEGPHEYFYEGSKVAQSVTAVVEAYFEKFDPDDAIVKMKRSARWPRPEYMMKNGVTWTDAQIKAYWDGVGLYARNRGTWMHYNIERYLNNLVPSEDCQEMSMFYKFYDEVIVKEKVLPWRTEWRIAAPEYDLAGSVDFVGKLPDGTYCIMDWKRSKNLASSLGNAYGRRGKPPLQHLDDTDASKYFLQLNVYRYILQKHYDIKISKMILASFHPSEGAFFHIQAPIWEQEVQAVMDHFSAQKTAERQTEQLNDAVKRTAVPPPVKSVVSRPKAPATKPKTESIPSPFA